MLTFPPAYASPILRLWIAYGIKPDFRFFVTQISQITRIIAAAQRGGLRQRGYTLFNGAVTYTLSGASVILIMRFLIRSKSN